MAIKNNIGYSPLTQKIYLGKVNKEKGMWVGEKNNITNDFLNVICEYIPENTTRTVKGLDTNSENIFLNVKNDKVSIEKAITHLKTLLT